MFINLFMVYTLMSTAVRILWDGVSSYLMIFLTHCTVVFSCRWVMRCVMVCGVISSLTLPSLSLSLLCADSLPTSHSGAARLDAVCHSQMITQWTRTMMILVILRTPHTRYNVFRLLNKLSIQDSLRCHPVNSWLYVAETAVWSNSLNAAVVDCCLLARRSIITSGLNPNSTS